jgi:hypothetical protein
MTKTAIYALLAVASLGVGTAFRLPSKPGDGGKAKAKSVTYATDIAPLVNHSCVSCHRDGEVAPFSLVGYDNAKKWASNIAAVTQKHVMPPWKAVQGYGEFRDDRQLTDDQIAMLKKWSDAGAPRGDKNLEPKSPVFKTEWALGTPDLILQPDKPFHLDAEGEDVYRNFVLKNTFDKPIWVKAIDVKPGNKKIVHHEITFIDGYGAAKRLEDANHDGQEGYTTSGGGVGFMPSGTLGGWAPGITAKEMPPGIAYIVKPGSTLVMQVHYHKDGKPEEDLTRLGLYFAKEPIKKEMKLDWVFNFGIDIPAGDKAYKATAVSPITQDVTLYSAMPHMHLLGHAMKSWVEFPDGSTKPLVWVDDWDFNWQLAYVLKEPMHVPKGSKIKVEAVYDNSTDNPRNPHSPPKDVTWGEQTTDEMFLMIVAFTLDNQQLSQH